MDWNLKSQPIMGSEAVKMMRSELGNYFWDLSRDTKGSKADNND